MTLPSLIRHNPGRRVSAFDGMAVTAEVWQEAHEYHRYQQQMHALNGHGTGILVGLEVIAGEPPSQTVYILPGAAIDPGGNLIVVEQPAAYDLGQYRDGPLHMLLTYDESRPQPVNGQYGDNPFFVYTGYNVETVAARPDSPQVEIARILRRAAHGPITNPADFYRPGVNEIDMRFRPLVAPLARSTVLVGVAYLSPMASHGHGQGLLNLARSVSMQPEMRVLVNDAIDLNGDLSEYTLLALVAKDTFNLDDATVRNLAEFIRKGGTLFVEGCHREGGENPSANGSFSLLISALGSRPRNVQRLDGLLAEPFFFAQPPSGYETKSAASLAADGGVVLSTYDYACLWQGDRRNGSAGREEIRAGMEWGHNLLLYAWKRRQEGRRV
ncbi:MAG: DUF4159 domain-containing protein [Caldilineaceae bacterium]|nr:DUF4159 domain-containing protein [Caldilineaceae bacterium]